MARKLNDSSGSTSGFSGIEVVAPVNPPPDPDSKPSTGDLSVWIHADMAFKEKGQNSIKYS